MSTATGIIQQEVEEPLWVWSSTEIALAADQAVFFVRRSDRALMRVAVSGSDSRSVAREPGCEALIVARSFGVRIAIPCELAGPVAGEIDTEVRLRLLDNAAEWPRRLPQSAALNRSESGAARALGDVVAPLFESEIAGFSATQSYGDLCRRLNDSVLIADLEARVRGALARWTEEGIISLVAIHVLHVRSEAGERERERAIARHRLEQDHQEKLQHARHAAELAEAERQRALAQPEEVRWRLFERADLFPAEARPPRLVKESSAPYETLVSGQHLQLLVRLASAGYVYVLALGPYQTDRGAEYRWMRLFGNGGGTELVQRAPRSGGNRLGEAETLLFPGDAGAAELHQHYLTMDSAPGWETLVVAVTPNELPDLALAGALPTPAGPAGDFRAFQDELNRALQTAFGRDARIYQYQFFHS